MPQTFVGFMLFGALAGFFLKAPYLIVLTIISIVVSLRGKKDLENQTYENDEDWAGMTELDGVPLFILNVYLSCANIVMWTAYFSHLFLTAPTTHSDWLHTYILQ